jgi:hypothetical protein
MAAQEAAFALERCEAERMHSELEHSSAHHGAPNSSPQVRGRAHAFRAPACKCSPRPPPSSPQVRAFLPREHGRDHPQVPRAQ